MRFVSNVDANTSEKTRDLDPETLFIVSSKTFTTLETMTNAYTARRWVLKAFGGDKAAAARHFVAVSTNAVEVEKFGIDTDNMFGFWDWVGGEHGFRDRPEHDDRGRPRRFRELLDGFHDMDEHFRTAPPRRNLPMIQALVGLWNACFWEADTVAILPYDQYLDRFSAYLQQLEMESNGKHVTLDGRHVRWGTCPIIWGQPGTNGQHAFYQMIHQGTRMVLRDFRLRRSGQPSRRPSRQAGRERLRPDGGPRVREDARGDPRRRGRSLGRTAQGDGGQPPHEHLPLREAEPVDARAADRPLRTQGVRAGPSGGQLRPVGRGARQEAGQAIVPELESKDKPRLGTTSTNALIRSTERFATGPEPCRSAGRGLGDLPHRRDDDLDRVLDLLVAGESRVGIEGTKRHLRDAHREAPWTARATRRRRRPPLAKRPARSST